MRVDLEQALAELKLGTPQACKQALNEAASSVEGAMKVLLRQRLITYDQRDTAHRLFEHLRDNDIVARDTEKMLLALTQARNHRGAHGAIAAHAVEQIEAEAFVAAAATAIAFLGKLL